MEWFKEWFASEEYLDVYKHRDNDDAQKLFELFTKTASLKKDSLILDAACGAGRHSSIFQKNGFNVVAFDLSKTLLDIAIKQNPYVYYLNCDIRKTPFKKKSFNLITNLFTSFGYFETDEENFKFLYDSYNLLKHKGYFLFDYFNSNFIIENLIDKSEKKVKDKKVTEERKIENSRVIKKITIEENSDKKFYKESVKLYSANQLKNLFEKIGYKKILLKGSYMGEDFDEKKSKRIIFICEK